MTTEDKIAELLLRKRELQKERELLLKDPKANALDVDLIDEEIADVTFQLTIARRGHRRNTKFAAHQKTRLIDAQQFWDWSRMSDDDVQDKRLQTMRDVAKDAANLMTQKQYESYSLWVSGMNQRKVASVRGVTHETVNASLKGAKRRLNEEADRRIRADELDSWVLDPGERKTGENIIGTLTFLQSVVLTLRMLGYSQYQIGAIIGQTRSGAQSAESHAYERLAKHYDGVPVDVMSNPEAMKRLIEEKFDYKMPDEYTAKEAAELQNTIKRYRNIFRTDTVKSGRTSAAWKRSEAKNDKCIEFVASCGKTKS